MALYIGRNQEWEKMMTDEESWEHVETYANGYEAILFASMLRSAKGGEIRIQDKFVDQEVQYQLFWRKKPNLENNDG